MLADGRGPLDVHNLVILSREPIVRQRQTLNELVPAPVAWDRPALCAPVELGQGRVLHVLNLHLRSPLAAFVPGQKTGPFAWKSVAGWVEGFFLASIKRTGQALEARLMVDEIFDVDAECLIAVCGDLNAELREMLLRILRGEEEDTGNGALAGRVLVPMERTVAESQRYSVLHGGRAVINDHVLVSRAVGARPPCRDPQRSAGGRVDRLRDRRPIA